MKQTITSVAAALHAADRYARAPESFRYVVARRAQIERQDRLYALHCLQTVPAPYPAPEEECTQRALFE